MNTSTCRLLLSRLTPLAAVLAVVFWAQVGVYGQTTTFAQFFERNGSQDFVVTNNTTSADFRSVQGGSPVYFLFQNINGLDPSLQGIQSAHLYVTTNTDTPGNAAAGTLTQPLGKSVTINIIRDTPTPEGVGGGLRTNLLTIVFSPNGNTPSVVGSDGGNSATLQATTPDHTVSFYSNFVSFGNTTSRNLALSFSSVSPSLELAPGSFLKSNTAAASGTFASNPVPVPGNPTAAKVSLTGRVFTPEGNAVKNATVTLVDGAGATRQVVTNSFGVYQFSEVTSGQTVFVTVRSKQYHFAMKPASLLDSLSDFDFIGLN